MAKYKQREDQFKFRFQSICEKYGKSVALMERFRRAGLMQNNHSPYAENNPEGMAG
jgi:hypothetical protein